MTVYFFRTEPGAAELRRLARHESGRVCQRVLMIANMLEGLEHEAAARLAGLSRSSAYQWHNRYGEDGIGGLGDRPSPGRPPRVDALTTARLKERIVAGAELERDGVVAFRGVRRPTNIEGRIRYRRQPIEHLSAAASDAVEPAGTASAPPAG